MKQTMGMHLRLSHRLFQVAIQLQNYINYIISRYDDGDPYFSSTQFVDADGRRWSPSQVLATH